MTCVVLNALTVTSKKNAANAARRVHGEKQDFDSF